MTALLLCHSPYFWLVKSGGGIIFGGGLIDLLFDGTSNPFLKTTFPFPSWESGSLGVSGFSPLSGNSVLVVGAGRFLGSG